MAVTTALLGLGTAVPAEPAGTTPQQTGPAVPSGGRYLEPVFPEDEVEITRDVTYRETENWHGNPVSLQLDIYEPGGDTVEKRPVILMMSGGFFAIINKELIFGAGEGYASMGYVVVSIEYRVRPDAGLTNFPNVDPEILLGAALDAYDDAFAAVAWIRERATELRIDPEAISAVGGSAGGNIAWNLVWLQGDESRPEPSGVGAAVALAGAPGPGEPDPGDPPVLDLHGADDLIIDIALAEVPCTAARLEGVRCDLVTYEGVGHPLDPRTPDILALHDDDISRRTVGFIAEVVLAPLGYFGPPTPPGPGPGPGPAPVAPPAAVPATPVQGQPAFTG